MGSIMTTRIMSEIGTSGLERYSGYVFEEFITKLRGKKGVKIYDQMANNDSIIGSILFAINMLIRQVKWRIEPASKEAVDIEAAKFLNSCLHDMEQPWSAIITEILTFLEYGWSWHEIVYKKRDNKNSEYNDGRIGWKKIAGRAQTSWDQWMIADNGDILGLKQRAAPDYKIREIPLSKSLLFRTTVNKNNPEGKSILRTAYRSWYFKKNIEQIQGIGIERDLAGLPVAYVPPDLLDKNASEEMKTILTQIKKIVTNIRRDEQEGIVFPKILDENGKDLYSLELMSTGGARQFDTKEIMEYYDQRIAMSVLADFVLLGHGKTGSFALSNDKTKMFSFAISAFIDIIQSTFNKYAVPSLFQINTFNINKYPKIVPTEIQHVTLKEISAYIKDLVGAGATLFPDETLENNLRAKAKLPLKNMEEIV